MLLGGGTLWGITVLDRASVQEAFTDQLGDVPVPVPATMPTTNPDWSADFAVGPGAAFV